MTISLHDGTKIGVFVINRAIRLPEIKERYEQNTANGIHTLYILDRRMLPPENGTIQPPHWMEALHTLTHGRIYTYHCDGRRVTIQPLHIEWRWGNTPRYVEYGEAVDVNNLRAEMVNPTSKYVTGSYAAAHFGEGTFWKKRSSVDEAQFRYSWRHWSYGPRKERSQEETAQADWDPWEEFSRHYGEVPGDEPEWDWANPGAQQQQQRGRRTARVTPAQPREHYAVLGIPVTASFEEVKQAYRRKAREYHPDLHPNEKEKYTAKMVEINTAFEAISRTQKRK